MDIHMDNSEIMEIHVWICYEFSDQGILLPPMVSLITLFKRSSFYDLNSALFLWLCLEAPGKHSHYGRVKRK